MTLDSVPSDMKVQNTLIRQECFVGDYEYVYYDELYLHKTKTQNKNDNSMSVFHIRFRPSFIEKIAVNPSNLNIARSPGSSSSSSKLIGLKLFGTLSAT